MKIVLSKEVNRVLLYAGEEAVRTGWSEITVDHAVLGMLRLGDCAAVTVLKDGLGIDPQELRHEIESHIDKGGSLPYTSPDAVSFSPGFRECFRNMVTGRFSSGDFECNTLHLLLAVLKDTQCTLSSILLHRGISAEEAVHAVEERCPQTDSPDDTPEGTSRPEGGQPGTVTSDGKSGSMLEQYCRDLTGAAREGLLDPVVGRQTQITRLEQILCRRRKNNPVLIGDPGVGKSAIVEGLAARLAEGDVPLPLSGKKIYALDMASLVAGAKYRGEFEERVKRMVDELRQHTDIILYIDELHSIVGAGSAPGTLDAAGLLKPALASGDLRCIGATTADEYRRRIERDSALERRFQKVPVEPPDAVETAAILSALAPVYGQFHGVLYTDDALKACVTLSDRYIPDRSQPDKSLDVLDEAGARARLNASGVPAEVLSLQRECDESRRSKREAARSRDFALAAAFRTRELALQKRLDTALTPPGDGSSRPPVTVSSDDIASVVSSMTGIPAGRIAASEHRRLLDMGDMLRSSIIGQDEAVEKVVRSIQRSRAGIKDPGRPVGTFLFLGPTGVGKTFLAKKLAEYMFGSRESLIRIDMNEYGEKYAASRLIGAPPGYVGYDDGGQLTEQVRRHPYSVVLLDEMEKAAPEIFNLLLQVLDEGRITDSCGRTVDFRNTILIMTSNAGSRELQDFGRGIGFQCDTSPDATARGASIVDKAVGRIFPPEFLNRIDEQIHFRRLDLKDAAAILDIQLMDLGRRLAQSGYRLSVSPGARAFIAAAGYDSRYGARPLKRAVRRYVEDPATAAILSGHSKEIPLKIRLDKAKGGTICI